jgi:hypothetical protein
MHGEVKIHFEKDGGPLCGSKGSQYKPFRFSNDWSEVTCVVCHRYYPKNIPCVHEKFLVGAVVSRVRETDGVVKRYFAEFRVTCLHCKLPFRFRAEKGVSQDKPMASHDWLELRAPLEPQNLAVVKLFPMKGGF